MQIKPNTVLSAASDKLIIFRQTW